MIIGTYFHGQNIEKHKKDKITIFSSPKFFSFHHFSVPKELRISEVLFAIWLTKTLIDNKKIFFSSLSNVKKIKR